MVTYHVYFRNDEAELLEWAKATYQNSLSKIIKQHLSELRQGSAKPVVRDAKTHEILVRRAYKDVFRRYEVYQKEQDLYNNLSFNKKKAQADFSDVLDNAWMKYKELYPDLVKMFFDKHGQLAKLLEFQNPLEQKDEEKQKEEE